MISFKQYLRTSLVESLYLKGINLNFSKELQKSPSEKDRISTFPLLPDGYTHTIKIIDDIKVRVGCLYNYRTTTISKDILKTLKGSGPYIINDVMYHSLLRFTVDYAVEVIGRQKVQFIIYPESSSHFLKDFIEMLEGKLSNVVFLHEGIIKKQLVATEEYVREHMIDVDYYGYEKMGPAKINDIVKSIIRNINKNDKLGKGKIITLKDVGNKISNHVVKGFMEVVHESIFDIADKKIMIIDDVLSTGSSFKDMIRVVRDFDPKEVVGLTIFKGISKND